MSTEFDPLIVELSYSGEIADEHQISLYDLSQALYGFERSLALTTHLILNGEIITQATALRGAQILCTAPKPGSLTILAAIGMAAGGAYKLTTLKKDNPLGHLVFSAYDYAVNKVTGQPVDYDKSLREIWETGHAAGNLGVNLPRESQFDSLAEKIEPPLTRMHRPIVRSGTAEKAEITFPEEIDSDGVVSDGHVITLDRNSYTRMKYRARADEICAVIGKISVFNPNTFNGRLFVPTEERNVPFYLTPAGRSSKAFELIGESYSKNLVDRGDESAVLEFDVLPNRTRLGVLSKYTVVKVKRPEEMTDEILESS